MRRAAPGRQRTLVSGSDGTAHGKSTTKRTKNTKEIIFLVPLVRLVVKISLPDAVNAQPLATPVETAPVERASRPLAGRMPALLGFHLEPMRARF